jgi:hypothetical protein
VALMLPKLDLRMSALEKADEDQSRAYQHTMPFPVVPIQSFDNPQPVPIPMLHETHCVVWLHGMSLVTEGLPHILRPGAYYDEDAANDFSFIRRSFERSQAAYEHRITWHTDTREPAPNTMRKALPLVQNAKLMDLVETMEKRRDSTRAMITTSALIFEEKMHGAETEAEREKHFGIVCFLQDLPRHPDFLRLEIDLLPAS